MLTDTQMKKLSQILEHLYWKEILSLREIAHHPSVKEFNIKTGPQVYYYLSKFRIDTRPRDKWWKIARQEQIKQLKGKSK